MTQPLWARVLAAAQAVGGALAIGGYAITAVRYPGTLAPWQLALGVAFGALACVAGALLHLGRPAGLATSITVQAVQVLAVSWVPVLSYVSLAGLEVRLVAATTGVHAQFGVGGEFIAVPWAGAGTLDAIGLAVDGVLGIAPGPLSESSCTVGVNVAALYFLARLVAARVMLRHSGPSPNATVAAPAV